MQMLKVTKQTFHHSSRVDFHPFLFAGGLLAKKAAVFAAARSYGWHRIYRRLLEQNKVLTPIENQEVVKIALREAMRFPLRAYEMSRDSHVIKFVDRLARSAGENAAGSTKVPPLPDFLRHLLEETVGNTKTGKWRKHFEDELRKKNNK
eukprot:g3253.t1